MSPVLKKFLKIPFYSAVACLFLIVGGCGSDSKKGGPVIVPDKILERIDGLSSRPDWLKESKPFQVEQGKVTALGSTTIPGDDRIESGYRIAELNARSELSKAIETKLEHVFQNVEEGTSIDQNRVSLIAGEASKLTTSSIRVENRYWEKVVTTNSDGQQSARYRIFSTVTIDEGEFKRAISQAMVKQKTTAKLSDDLIKKANTQLDHLLTEEKQ